MWQTACSSAWNEVRVKIADQSKMRSQAAFTLMEGVVALMIVGISFVALYSGLTYGFSRVQFSRENHRATQILIEKMETIRLYSWTQLNTPGYIPKKFEVSYYPNASVTEAGVLYKGELAIEDSDMAENYGDAMKKVTVMLTWKSGKIERERSLSTYVSQLGLHKSVY